MQQPNNTIRKARKPVTVANQEPQFLNQIIGSILVKVPLIAARDLTA
jgi:hypothetical protein